MITRNIDSQSLTIPKEPRHSFCDPRVTSVSGNACNYNAALQHAYPQLYQTSIVLMKTFYN